MPALPWSLAALLALGSAGAAPVCDRSCEPLLQDVFGCCPPSPTSTGRVGPLPDRGSPALAFEGSDGRTLLGMKIEVSQALYQAVTGQAPSAHAACGASCPVERVTWCDAVAFANRLSARDWLQPVYGLPDGFRPGMDAASCDGLAGEVTVNARAGGWRLPTEAEWAALVALEGGPSPSEAASRRVEGRSRPPCDGNDGRQGVCDAVGNVWEWVWDADPDGRRAVRGCSFQCPPGTAGAGSRLAVAPGLRDEGIGFRLVRAR